VSNKFACMILVVFMAINLSGLVLAKNLSTEEDYLKQIGQLKETGKIDEAILINREMITSYPQNLKGYGSLALLFLDKGDYDEAIAKCEQAISLAPTPLLDKDRDGLYLVYSTLSNIYAKQLKLDNAIEAIKKAIALKPKYADGAYWSLGIYYTQIEKWTEARAAFHKMIEIGNKGESKGALTEYAEAALIKIKGR